VKWASADGVTWPCPSCGGRAIGMGLLRRLVDRTFANHLWVAAMDIPTGSGRNCAICHKPMTLVPWGPAEPDPLVDVCRRCQFVWFDPTEFEAAPHLPKVVQRQLPQEALEATARLQAVEIARDWQVRYPASDLPSARAIPAILGLPLEDEGTFVSRIPLVTWGIALLMTFAGILQLAKPGLIQEWGFIATDPFRKGGLTAVTAFFLHSGLFHFASDLWFLAVFGDDVEEFLGRLNFALLLFVAGLVGAGAHGLLGDSHVPLVGASGALSGVIVFYALKFPDARLRYFRLLSGWITMPASLALGFWVFSQLFASRDWVGGQSDLSLLAHLGGAAVGFGFWWMWRND
jgi:membrane associated rhomboid family serine protease